MFEALLQYNALGLFILRLAVGIIFIYHALPKLKNAAGMAKGVGMPAPMIAMLGGIELLAGAGLIIGLLVQLAALLLSVIMLGAVYFKVSKWHTPFAAMDKTGWEFDLILLAANVALLLGSGGNIGVQ